MSAFFTGPEGLPILVDEVDFLFYMSLVKSALNFARFNDHVAIVTGGSRGIGK